jgi:hypothetical protein
MKPRAAVGGLLLGSALASGCGLLINLDNLAGGGTGGGGTGGATASSSRASTGVTTGSSVASTTASNGSTGSTSGSGGGGGDAGTEAGPDGGPLPPVLPAVAIMSAGLDFKIDATEVTAAQYLTFVKSYEAAPFAQRDVCGWNKSVEPNVAPPNDAGIAPNQECDSYDLEAEALVHPNAPVRCIDWCDAATYCTWAGGHMCQGDEGKPYPPEWKTACGSAAATTFPYGDMYNPHQCVDSPAMKPLDVHSKPLCQGGFPGLFDMSGNVGEWLDCGCEYDDPDPVKTNAFVGGGSYLESGTALACNPTRTAPLISFNTDVGARCCYAP